MVLTRSRPSAIVAFAAIATGLLVGCGGDDGGTTDLASPTPVLATTSIWADVTSQVGCGTDVPSLVPAGADPHTFEPSLRDRERLDRATTVIANGLDLESTILPMLDVASDEGVVVIELATDVDVLVPDGDEHDGEGHDSDDTESGHSHGEGGDPHFWQDPRRVAGTLDTMAPALAANDVTTCLDGYRAELESLDNEIEAMLAPVPDDRRRLVTSHRSLAYFADRYDFEIIGTVIPSMSTMAEANAADLADLADQIDRHDVSVIFTDTLSSSADADALADRLGVAVVPLVTDTLTDDPAGDTYVEMMRHNASLIAEHLAP